MNALLICPEHRPVSGQFHRMRPLALMPVLGRSLIDYSLSKMAREGFTDVVVLASDRPGQIRQAVRDGAAWGLRVRVLAVSLEPDAQLAPLAYAREFANGKVDEVRVLDRCTLAENDVLWQSSEGMFSMYRAVLADDSAAAQLTMREVSPGVWISTKARVSTDAMVTGPAWIGPYASVRGGAHIGPHTIIEAGAFIDCYTVVEESWVGPDTFIGPAMNVQHSLAWGNGLTNWRNGEFLEVSDAFLMCDISRAPRSERRCSICERLTAVALMIAALPAVLLRMIGRLIRRQTVFRERRCILPPLDKVSQFTRTYALLTLEGAGPMVQRWPELWLVIRGDMALIGNRPLSKEAASALRGDSARNWLGRPAGVFSLADAERVDGECTTEALAYAAYFAARNSLRLRLSILLRCLAIPVREFLASAPTDLTSEPKTV